MQTLQFVIKYSDGAYNEGAYGTPRNGFPVDLFEATRYDTLAQAEEKAIDLFNIDGSNVEIQSISPDGILQAVK